MSASKTTKKTKNTPAKTIYVVTSSYDGTLIYDEPQKAAYDGYKSVAVYELVGSKKLVVKVEDL
jgi:hypothetical protein